MQTASYSKETIPALNFQNGTLQKFIQKVVKELVWIKEAALIRFLEKNPSIGHELVLLGYLSPADVERGSENGKPLLERLVQSKKLKPAFFAKHIRVKSGLPLSHPQKGTFIEHLLTQKLVTYPEISGLLSKEGKSGNRIEQLLIEAKVAEEEEVYNALAEFLDVSFEKELEIDLPGEILSAFQNFYLETFQLLPLSADDKEIQVCSFQPIAETVLESFQKSLSKKVSFSLCTKAQFDQGTQTFNELRKEMESDAMQTIETDSYVEYSQEAFQLQADSTVELVAALVQKAVDYRATDIHLEPRREGLNIRYRVDGFLHQAGNVDHQVGREIISRIKILTDMDITERRLPQDGHFRFGAGDAEYDMRISTVPTNFGERMEIRLAEGGKVFTGIDQLGMTQDNLDLLQGFVRKPHGIVLATGPVGSGKTTTLYSCISNIDRSALNVMTIEDPIEYIIPGANQIEVNYKVNFDFVHGLRAILRQDPNVILVGEIRDDETAKIAIRAGLTGMLVLSTLHANEAVGSVTTLLNFGINRFLIANALVGSVAQRLVRKICPHCKQPIKADRTVRDALKLKAADLKGFKLSRGVGCDKCFQTGYRGRTGIFEIFNVNDRIRNLIMEGGSEEELKKAAAQEGLVPLRSDGIEKIKEGHTTVEEFVRVLG